MGPKLTAGIVPVFDDRPLEIFETHLGNAAVCGDLAEAFNPAGPVFGRQSAGGSRFVETLLTAIESCRQQGRDVFAWVTVALQSRFAGEPCRSLLPGV